MNKKSKYLLFIAIIASFVPYLALYSRLDFAQFESNRDVFFENALFITANILGFIGATLLIWQFALGVRYLTRIITPDLVWVNKLHKWLGKYGILLIFLHPILERYVYLEGIFWTFSFSIATQREIFISIGRLALLLLGSIWITSAIFRKKLKFRPWMYIHYLAYPVMLFVFLHAINIGTFIAEYPTLKALWYTYLLLYLLLLVFRFVMFSGITKAKYELVEKKSYGDNTYVIKFKAKGRQITAETAQFMYLQLHAFGESHPFTIMSLSSDTKEIVFGVKVLGKFSKAVSELQVGDSVKIDGPYGVFTSDIPERSPIAIFAGGIGITPFIEYVNQNFDSDILLFNSNKLLKQAVDRDNLKEILGDKYFDFITQESIEGENIINERVSMENLSNILSDEDLKNRYHLICGSISYVETVRGILENLGVSGDKIKEEEFGL